MLNAFSALFLDSHSSELSDCERVLPEKNSCKYFLTMYHEMITSRRLNLVNFIS